MMLCLNWLFKHLKVTSAVRAWAVTVMFQDRKAERLSMRVRVSKRTKDNAIKL